MISPLMCNECFSCDLSYLFFTAVAMGLRTLLDEAQDTKVEAPHVGSINFLLISGLFMRLEFSYIYYAITKLASRENIQ